MKNIVIIGSGSDLSKELVKQIDKNEYKVYFISREESMAQNQNKLTVDDYENELNSITAFIDDISNPYLIFFNGYLKENRPSKIPSDDEVLDTFKINFYIPYLIINNINKENFKRIIIISTVAAIKPRLKNYIYGISKSLLEKFLIKSVIENYLIIRFGFIYSKMSQKHDPAPFAIEKSDAAKFIIKSLSNNKNLIYYPKVLFIISLIFKIVPSSLLDKIENK
tara:strand:- start:5398 stop:6066 length:669 start_codon:yes stop_codon:yes gene_type:complete